MKNRILISLFLLTSVVAYSQDKGTDYEGTEYINVGGTNNILTVEQLNDNYMKDSETYSFPESIYKLSDPSILFNESFEKNDIGELKSELLKNALYLASNQNFSHYGKDGLAYVWGSKNSSKKTKPSKYKDKSNICSEELYGLDCSGFIYEILIKSDVQLPEKPRNYANARWFSKAINWKKPLDEYLNCINCYKVFNPKIKDLNSIESGDIIYFKVGSRVYHIGIALMLNDDLLLFESTGSPRKNCSSNIKMGPRVIRLTKSFLENKSFGILRFEAI